MAASEMFAARQHADKQIARLNLLALMRDTPKLTNETLEAALKAAGYSEVGPYNITINCRAVLLGEK